MRHDLIVSVHIPKTAGTSFFEAVKIIYPQNQIISDYDHPREFRELTAAGVSPCNLHRQFLTPSTLGAYRKYRSQIARIDYDTKFIHGHFPAKKYLPLLLTRRAAFITWLRDPFERTLSNYFYWMSLDTAEVEDDFVIKIRRENWSLEKFCFHPSLRNYQSLWLHRFPRRLLSFIGLTEYFAEDLQYLEKTLFEVPLTCFHSNKTIFEDSHKEYEHLRKRFEAYHSRDMDLYNYARRRRDRRI